MGGFLFLVCVVGAIYSVVKAHQARSWHMQGVGERQGRAEYARISREQPDSADGRLSEAEFVDKFVNSKPGAWRYIVFTLLFVFVGFPITGFMWLLK